MSSIGSPLGSSSRAGSRDDLDDPDPRESPPKAPSVAGSEPKGELKTMGEEGVKDYDAWKTGRGMNKKGRKKGGDGEPELQVTRNTSKFPNMDKDIDFQVLLFIKN